MTKKYDFNDLVEVFKALRNPESGCPWDLKQTHKSITKHLIEETYELVDAIENNPEKIKEELGDVLLQVMLHSQIASDEKNFCIKDVIQNLCEKLIERHPHVFSNITVKDTDEVLKNWEIIKKSKNKQTLLAGVPKSLPALLKTDIIGKKVVSVGFDWDSKDEIKAKIKEELDEFLEEQRNSKKSEEEFGDLLFTIVQLGRKSGYDLEKTLQDACDKFIKRFDYIENEIGSFENVSREKLEELWKKAKG